MIERLRSPSIVHEAIGNVALQHMAGRLLEPAYGGAMRGRGRNYVGNIMEHLSWIAVEEGSDELVLALAYYIMSFRILAWFLLICSLCLYL